MSPFNLKTISCVFVFLVALSGFAQQPNFDKWRAQFALGVNHPANSGFANNVEAKPVNFPTINLGIQRMITRQIGVRLEYGFNRFSNNDNSPEFKINYSRINALAVFDPLDYIKVLPEKLRLFFHGGPGLTFIKPLGNLTANKENYLNLNIGSQIHYDLSETVTVFTDLSYLLGISTSYDFDPALAGLGEFKGNLLTLTVGISISLTHCYYCNQ